MNKIKKELEKLNKATNYLILFNIPTIVITYFTMKAGNSHEFLVRTNYQIISLIVGITAAIIYYLFTEKIPKKIIPILLTCFVGLTLITYYAALPLFYFGKINGLDKSIRKVVFYSEDYPFIADYGRTECNKNGYCYLLVKDISMSLSHKYK